MLLGLILSFAMQSASMTSNLGARVIAQEEMSNVDEPRQVVARTPVEWESLWRLNGSNKPAPKVDFGKESVVAIFLGSRPTPGYSPHFIRSGIKDNVLTLQWIERRPDTGVILAQVLTSPALFAVIPKFDGEVKFEKVEPR